MWDEITLIAENITVDELGMSSKTYTRTDTLCEVNSITRQEFFEAGRNGLNPEYEMTVFFGNYNGERIVEYKGEQYGVYRTYRTGDYMELYVERKGGLIVGSESI
jgi:SPP1 family predicted phage head-tail adaptor